MRVLYLCGAGNPEGVRLALNINRASARWDRITLLDDDSSIHGESILGVEVAGAFDLLEKADRTSSEVCNLVARTTSGRQAARDRIAQYGLPFASLISPDVDTLGSTLPTDITIYQNATIGPAVSIAEGTVVFIGGIVGHGSQVGRCCVVAPNAVINARVEIEEGVYVGTNATILPEVKIGAWATIGAGSVAVLDVPPAATVMGVPGEVLLSHHDDVEEIDSGEPLTHVEEVLRAIWVEAIGKNSLGIHDSFFDVEGSSLCMMQIASGIRREFGLEIPLLALFQNPTIARMACIVEEKTGVHAEDHAGQLTVMDIARRRRSAHSQ